MGTAHLWWEIAVPVVGGSIRTDGELAMKWPMGQVIKILVCE